MKALTANKYNKSEGWLVNRRGQRLYTASYSPPDKKPPTAILFFHHGVGDHIGRYEKAFGRMSQNGLAIHGFDAHGHGKSEPAEASKRAYVASFHYLVQDFLDVVDNALKQQQDGSRVPIFIGGHSMGGLVAAHTVLMSQSRWSGMLLHSPALDVEWTTLLRVQAKVGGLLSWAVPEARLVPAVRTEDMSQDPQVVKDYLADPLITHGNVCARTANELLHAFRELDAKSISIPVYVAHGTNDRCTSLGASRRFVSAVASNDATLYEFEGGYHELLQGPESQEATDRMVQWMARHAGKVTSRL